MVNVIPSFLNSYFKAEASATPEKPIVVDDGVFTLTIGPSSSGNADTASAGATGAVAVHVRFSLRFARFIRVL